MTWKDTVSGTSGPEQERTNAQIEEPPWRPQGSPTRTEPPRSDARWSTVWWLLVSSLAVSVCAFWLAWDSQTSARAFVRSSHQVSATVIERDCEILCRGGPFVSVAYDHPVEGRVVARLDQQRDVEVGDVVTVVYSDDRDARGYVVLAPSGSSYDSSARWWAVTGVASLLLALLAWAFPANLRRFDRRDARRNAAPAARG